MQQGIAEKVEFEKIIDTIYKNTYNFLIKNPDNYFSISELISYKTGYSKHQLSSFYKKLSPKMRASTKGIILKNYIDVKKVQIVDIAPKIIANTLSGKKNRLSNFKGKYILLDFWTSWCIPCIQKMEKDYPTIKKQFSEKDLQIISFSFDKDKSSWERMSKKLNIDWINISNLINMRKSSVAFNYGVSEISTSFIMSPEGKILKRISYDDNIQEELEKVIKNTTEL